MKARYKQRIAKLEREIEELRDNGEIEDCKNRAEEEWDLVQKYCDEKAEMIFTAEYDEEQAYCTRRIRLAARRAYLYEKRAKKLLKEQAKKR
jgi:hypothetical protein